MLKKRYWYPAIVLIVFLIAGLILIRDYGASADEHVQIEGGHVMWRYLCLKLHREVPDALKNEPDLHDFKNSYYGQAATFPTVVLEAVRNFTADISTVVKIRHYWNFLSYFIGLCCFSAALTHLTRAPRLSAVWLLLQILLPRIFGDIFYNDRDVMLISWMMISLSAFYLFTQRPGWLTSLLCALTFAVAVNTRIFGLTLLVFPFLYFVFSGKRKYLLLFVPAVIIFWFLFSPIAWDDPLHTLPDSFRHFSTRQRFLDTNNEAELIFFGSYYKETELPWYYIPMYIAATTPLVTLLFGLIGVVSVGRMTVEMASRGKKDVRVMLGTGMIIILLTVPLVGILFHLTFYNGWRHFYFLYIPITWLGFEGVCFVLKFGKRLLSYCMALLLCVSFVLSIVWIISVHPYQIIYLSPVFREQWIGKLDRDYWLLSTTECMKYLLENSEKTDLNVVDKYAFIEYSYIGLPPQDRERFHTMYHSAQPVPYDYLFFNYSGSEGNDARFDYYVPVYAVERDGIKLTEIFQRSHNNELRGPDIVENISASENQEQVGVIADNDYGTAWNGDGPGEIVIRFSRNVTLESMEVFPAEGSAGFRNIQVSVSSDGKVWDHLECRPKGSNGVAFPQTETSWVKLESDNEAPGIREILFYGS